MEQMVHLAKTWYMQYGTEIVLGLLACIAVLMIMTLIAVRRCRRQVRDLNENTREFLKYSLQQREAPAYRQPEPQSASGERTGVREREVTAEDEEVFGSVIREMFS